MAKGSLFILLSLTILLACSLAAQAVVPDPPEWGDESADDVEAYRTHVLAGHNINGRDAQGWTPLMTASASGNARAVRFLLEEGADACLRESGTNKASARDLAMTFHDMRMQTEELQMAERMKKMAGKGRSWKEQNPVHQVSDETGFAARTLECVELLKKAEATQKRARTTTEPTNTYLSGWLRAWETSRPFWVALEEGDVEALRAEVHGGQDINARNGDGFTSLMRATLGGNVAIVVFLLEEGADVSALHTSTNSSALDIAELLRADLLKERRDKGRSWQAKNPEDLDSKLVHYAAIVQLLKKAGACKRSAPVQKGTPDEPSDE